MPIAIAPRMDEIHRVVENLQEFRGNRRAIGDIELGSGHGRERNRGDREPARPGAAQ
jgi:hypothetical protein